MIYCYVFFDDLNILGKVSELIASLYDDIKIIRILDAKQIKEPEHSHKDLIITDYKSFQNLELNDLNENNFQQIFIIDEMKNETDGNITYININHLASEITTGLNDYIQNKKLGVSTPLELDKVNTEVNAVQALYEYITDLGFDRKVIELTKSLHKDIETKYSHKYMRALLNRFKQMEGSYLYNHSFLTSIIALSAGKNYTWMNYENKEKIYLGAILHDLGHQYKENSLRESMPLSEIEKLSLEDQDDIKKHPERFAKQLMSVDNIHIDVIKIVQYHHGVHGDDSYPKKLSQSEVNLVFALFILSHEMTVELYKINFNLDKIEHALNKISQKFNYGSFKKILPDFKSTIIETFITETA